MSGYYHPPPAGPADNGDLPPQIYDQSALPSETQQQLSSANLARWFDLDSDNNSAPGPRPPVRARRRPAGSDHVKHRRTRSGCYTCRSRRVKCDETHPICERCKKGSRECVYPEPTTGTKATPGSKLGQARRPSMDSGSSSEEYEDEELELSPGTTHSQPDMAQQPRNRASLSNVRAASRKQSRQAMNPARTGSMSMSVSQVKENSLSPSTDDSTFPKSRSTSATLMTSGKLSSVSTNTSLETSPWSHLPPPLQHYLDYHQQHLNHHHYLFKHDETNFIHSTLLDIALEYEPLLYAVVGFAAFHSTLQNPNGKIQDFLSYYNKAVSLLRKSLQAGQKHTDATVLAILQLAAFEEYLGDWVNLLGHQKAAYEMLLELYTPQTMVQTETRRKIFFWYMRFDLYAGLMSGYETTLGREWVAEYDRYCDEMVRLEPHSLHLQIESFTATFFLLGLDMAVLFAKLPRGAITIQDFMQENNVIAEKIDQCRTRLLPLMNMPEYQVMSFEGAPRRDPDDIVDPYKPGGLYKGALWGLNFILIDLYAIDATQKYQTSLILQQPLLSELERNAMEQCRILEAIEFWPGSPAGAILPAQASLGLICLLLPRDEKIINWCRRKLLTVETMGYIYPPAFRDKVAELWGIPELRHWWLPNDEGYTPIIRTIRVFIEERTVQPRNQTGEDVRSMKAMLSSLNLDDSPRESPESSGSLGAEVAAHYHQAEANLTAVNRSVPSDLNPSVTVDTETLNQLGAWGTGGANFYSPESQ